MGRRNKRKVKQQQQRQQQNNRNNYYSYTPDKTGNKSNKRRKRESHHHVRQEPAVRFWVQDCHLLPEVSPFILNHHNYDKHNNDTRSSDVVTLVVSRIQLMDHYRHIPSAPMSAAFLSQGNSEQDHNNNHKNGCEKRTIPAQTITVLATEPEHSSLLHAAAKNTKVTQNENENSPNQDDDEEAATSVGLVQGEHDETTPSTYNNNNNKNQDNTEIHQNVSVVVKGNDNQANGGDQKQHSMRETAAACQEGGGGDLLLTMAAASNSNADNDSSSRKTPLPLPSPPSVCLVLDDSCFQAGDDDDESFSEHPPDGSLVRRDLPRGDCGDGVINPHDPKKVLCKYWAQRRRFFTKFDHGIQVDQEGWFSVTPEAIAKHICQRIVLGGMTAAEAAPYHNETINQNQLHKPSDNNNNSKLLVLLDAFGGVGGNTIAFAQHAQVALVVCADTNQNRLAMAANNCRVYNISSQKVVFVHCDAGQIMSRYENGTLKTTTTTTGLMLLPPKETTKTIAGYRVGGLALLPPKLDGIFLSPPWGGPDYRNRFGPSHFDLQSILVQPHSQTGVDLVRSACRALPPLSGSGCSLAVYLPRNTNGIQVAQQVFLAVTTAKEQQQQEQQKASLHHKLNLELEQQYLCSKLKTVTLYVGDCAKKSPDGEKDAVFDDKDNEDYDESKA